MKKYLFVCMLGLTLVSCTTIKKTAHQERTPFTFYNTTVADVEVYPIRISYTYKPSSAIRRGGVENCKNAAVQEALVKYGNADFMFEPEFIVSKYNGLFTHKVTSVTVTGRPVKYKNFRTVYDKTTNDIPYSNTQMITSIDSIQLDKTDDSNSSNESDVDKVNEVAKQAPYFVESKLIYATITNRIVLPNNEIWYESVDDKVVKSYSAYSFGGAKIVNNIYENGKGIITFQKDKLKIIEQEFTNSTNLSAICFPNSITKIEEGAFYKCSNLTAIVIPSATTSIGSKAFAKCTKLHSITNLANKPQDIKSSTFKGCGFITLHVRQGLKSVYAANPVWGTMNIVDDIPN